MRRVPQPHPIRGFPFYHCIDRLQPGRRSDNDATLANGDLFLHTRIHYHACPHAYAQADRHACAHAHAYAGAAAGPKGLDQHWA
jgi:hypothetical protein